MYWFTSDLIETGKIQTPFTSGLASKAVTSNSTCLVMQKQYAIARPYLNPSSESTATSNWDSRTSHHSRSPSSPVQMASLFPCLSTHFVSIVQTYRLRSSRSLSTSTSLLSIGRRPLEWTSQWATHRGHWPSPDSDFALNSGPSSESRSRGPKLYLMSMMVSIVRHMLITLQNWRMQCLKGLIFHSRSTCNI